MIIWCGHGYLVAVAIFVSSLLMELFTESATGNDQYYQQSVWAFPVALLVAAGIIFALDRIVFKDATTQHSLFFVPLKWWAPIVVGLALIALVYQAVNV